MRRGLLLVAGLALMVGTPVGAADLRLELQTPLQQTAGPLPQGLVLWRDRSDFGRDGFAETVLATGQGRVYFVADGRLVAADLATGKRRWAYGSGLRGPIAYAEGRVYLAAGAGQVVALAASTGRRLWRVDSRLNRINRFRTHDRTLFANSPQDGGVAISASGRVRWRISEFGSHGPVAIAGKIVLWRVYQGEPGFDHILAYDLQTGRRLWRATHARGPLAIEGTRVYVADEWVWTQLDNPDNTQIRIIDLKSGRELKRWKYRTENRCPLPGVSLLWKRGEITVHGPHLYVGERCGDLVARFARGGARTPLRRYATFDGGKWIAGPFGGMLFFLTNAHQLLGVPLEGGQAESIRGVWMPTGQPRRYETTGAPIVRLDLDVRHVFVSQRDGWFQILDFRSGKRLGAVQAAAGGRRLGGWEYKPVIRSGDYLIVQPEGEVMVLRLPL